MLFSDFAHGREFGDAGIGEDDVDFPLLRDDLIEAIKVGQIGNISLDASDVMVAVQEQSKYNRTAGVDFGPVDVVKYAEAFGAVGFMIEAPYQIGQTLRKAFEIPGPVLIGLQVDYRDNHKLFENVHEHLLY
jgi:acetolactate synthase-1/2/3 large subunit